MKVRIYFTDGRRGDISVDEPTWERLQDDLVQYRRYGVPKLKTYPGIGTLLGTAPLRWTLVFPDIADVRRVPVLDWGGLAWHCYRFGRRQFRLLRALFRWSHCCYRHAQAARRPLQSMP